MAEKHDCKDCIRYVPNEKFDPDALLSAEGYCRVPERCDGLLGNVLPGDTLNIIFARGPYRCRDGTRWFEPKSISMDGEPMGDPHPCDMSTEELDRYLASSADTVGVSASPGETFSRKPL